MARENPLLEKSLTCFSIRWHISWKNGKQGICLVRKWTREELNFVLLLILVLSKTENSGASGALTNVAGQHINHCWVFGTLDHLHKIQQPLFISYRVFSETVEWKHFKLKGFRVGVCQKWAAIQFDWWPWPKFNFHFECNTLACSQNNYPCPPWVENSAFLFNFFSSFLIKTWVVFSTFERSPWEGQFSFK